MEPLRGAVTSIRTDTAQDIHGYHRQSVAAESRGWIATAGDVEDDLSLHASVMECVDGVVDVLAVAVTS